MPVTVGHDSANTRQTLDVNGKTYAYYSLDAAEKAGLGEFSRLPAALKVVLENMLRFEDGKTVSTDDIKAFSDWAAKGGKTQREIAYRPARVLMQDFTGVPAVVDLAAMRDGIVALGGDAEKINPLNPVDLVIDHSVMIDEFGNPRAFQMNVDREYERNMERYTFLKWGQSAFDNFQVVPPGTGICHQVNLEYLSKTVWSDKDQNGDLVAYPDTLVGTDSHTTMVNGAAVLGWGVGGIEAEAAMLGQPISMLIPEVIGFKLTGRDGRGHDRHRPCAESRTDAARKGRGRQIRRILRRRAGPPAAGRPCHHRQHGSGIRRDLWLLPDRRRDPALPATRAATTTAVRWSRPMPRPRHVARRRLAIRSITDTLSLDMGDVVPALAGPKRPQDRGADRRQGQFRRSRWRGTGPDGESRSRATIHDAIGRRGDRLDHLLHQHLEPVRDDRRRSGGAKGAARGLKRKPWVKTSLAPGSRWSRLSGSRRICRTISTRWASTWSATAAPPASATRARCSPISQAIERRPVGSSRPVRQPQLRGPDQPAVRANYLASPPLVVAYALAGTMTCRPGEGPAGQGQDGNDVYPEGHLAQPRRSPTGRRQ